MKLDDWQVRSERMWMNMHRKYMNQWRKLYRECPEDLVSERNWRADRYWRERRALRQCVKRLTSHYYPHGLR